MQLADVARFGGDFHRVDDRAHLLFGGVGVAAAASAPIAQGDVLKLQDQGGPKA